LNRIGRTSASLANAASTPYHPVWQTGNGRNLVRHHRAVRSIREQQKKGWPEIRPTFTATYYADAAWAA